VKARRGLTLTQAWVLRRSRSSIREAGRPARNQALAARTTKVSVNTTANGRMVSATARDA